MSFSKEKKLLSLIYFQRKAYVLATNDLIKVTSHFLSHQFVLSFKNIFLLLQGGKLSRSLTIKSKCQSRVSFDPYLKCVDVRSFCMSYISMYPCACVYVYVFVCIHIDECECVCFVLARTRFPFVEKTRDRDSAIRHFCVYHQLFYNVSRGMTGFSLLNDLEAVSVISKKKKQRSGNNARGHSGRYVAYTGLNRSDFCINSYI